MNFELNARGAACLDRIAPQWDALQIAVHELAEGGRFFDFGVESPGGLNAGLQLARVCLSDLAEVSLTTMDRFGSCWPAVQVATDHPVAACLFSQYAGWEIKTDEFFAMGSGPMRAAAAREDLFERLAYRETSRRVVGVLETAAIPGPAVYRDLAERCQTSPAEVDLLGASVFSQAGNVQVVARSIETALHKLFELGYDVTQIQAGLGTAPLPPVAKDNLSGIGRTNDAILYGGTVSLWVAGDDHAISSLGPQVPSESSSAYGKPFVRIFEEAGRDFYKIDPHLFSPAAIIIHNLETGNVFRYGHVNEDVLRQSFGL